MLVLTRRVGEEIIIADGIKVSVVEIRGGRVQLGFQAPPDVRIQRRELLRRPDAGETELRPARLIDVAPR
jgi:carbon storage regulator